MRSVVARWLSAILVFACLILGSRPAIGASSRTGAQSEASETTPGCPLVRSSKRSGVRSYEPRRGSPGSAPAILPEAIALPIRAQAGIDELVRVSIDHRPPELHAAPARAPPRS